MLLSGVIEFRWAGEANGEAFGWLVVLASFTFVELEALLNNIFELEPLDDNKFDWLFIIRGGAISRSVLVRFAIGVCFNKSA